MRWLFSAVLYTAVALGANTAFADIAALEALRDGTMKKLVFLAEPAEVSQEVFTDPDGGSGFTYSNRRNSLRGRRCGKPCNHSLRFKALH